ncbi:MAG: tetratricopeptide repeat protein [Candidatus Melainabacteria bacterium]|nr:tetratricopeptide repeat protein [Candidatus Melainabacteria bacterium]
MKKDALIFGFLLFVLGGSVFLLNTPSRYLLESNAYLTNGKVARAVTLLESGLKKYPDNSKIVYSLAKAYLLLGETEQANKTMLTKYKTEKFKTSKTLQDFFVELSEANHRLGNNKYARLFGEKYLSNENPNEVSKRVVKNYICIGQVFPERSVELWERAYNVASALKNSELKESVKALLMPKYLQLAQDLKSIKSFDEALNILQKAKILGKNAEVNYQEALIYSELGKINLSQKNFEEALQIEPDNDNYKIAYANALKNAAIKTHEQDKRTEYLSKIKLLLVDGQEDPRKASILNKIMYLNAKYKITNDNFKLTMVGDFFYPSIVFKIKPVSDISLKKYKVIFFDGSKSELDTYEAPVTEGDLEQTIEVTCRNPVDTGNLINAKIFLNDEFVKEYSNK